MGRRSEWGVLEAALGSLDAHGQGVIQVAGEQGIGKTRLLTEVCAEAERRRFLVFSGRAIEFDPGEAFGVFVDALDDYLASLSRRDVDDLVVEVGELAWVFPAMARLVEHPGGFAAGGALPRPSGGTGVVGHVEPSASGGAHPG